MCLEFSFTVVSILGEVGKLSTILPVRCTGMPICKWSALTSFQVDDPYVASDSW